MKHTTFIAAGLVCALVGAPTLSFAKARGGGGGGFSSGSRGGSSSGSMGSRGARTHQDNGAKPIEQSTTARPAATPPTAAAAPSPAARPAPAAQPSWIQRNPLLAGIAGGLAGTWLGHMIFGASETSARTTDAGEQGGDQGQAGAGSNSMLLLLMVMGAGGLWWYLRTRRTPAPDFSGLRRTVRASEPVQLSSAVRYSSGATAEEVEITTADKLAFQQALTDVQAALSRQDLPALRRLVTPEMLEYFSQGLAEQASEGTANRVEHLVLGQAEVREAWEEGATQYATVDLRWRALDYTVSLSKQPGEAGYLVEGSDREPSETQEVWTFMRFGSGNWLLSAIQQPQ